MKLIRPEEQKRLRQAVTAAKKPRRLTPDGDLVHLACDHYTTAAVQQLYSAWRTSPDLYMCEICGIEVAGKPVKERAPQPDDPPF